MIGRLATATLVLVAIYATMLGSVAAADLAIGAAIGAALLLAAGQPRERSAPPPPLARRVACFVPWLGSVLGGMAGGALRVARATLQPARSAGAVVAVPIGERSREGVAVTALAASASPGDLVVDIDWEEGAIYVHVVAVDSVDPEAVRRRYRRQYERFQRGVFP